MVNVIGEFDRLCSEAMAAYDEELEFSYEEALLRILDFVKENPASKKEFVSEFKSILMSATHRLRRSPSACESFSGLK